MLYTPTILPQLLFFIRSLSKKDPFITCNSYLMVNQIIVLSDKYTNGSTNNE